MATPLDPSHDPQPTAPLIGQRQGQKYTTASREAAYDTFRQWAEHRCQAGARFFFADAERALGIGAKTSRALAARAIADGWLISYGQRSGMAVVGLAPRDVTLADLVALAERSQGPAAETAKGRRDVTAQRSVHAVSTPQYESARAAAGVVAWGLTGDRRALGAVGREHFGWDEGTGEFALVGRIAQWSDALKGATTAVARKANKAAREKHVAGLRLLLDLAATKGVITRGPARAVSFAVYAPELHPWVEATTEALAGASVTEKVRAKRRAGVRVLAHARTVVGALDDTRVDWGAVTDTVRRGDYTAAQLADARAAYAAMRTVSLLPSTVPAWGRRQRVRPVLVPFPACKAAGQEKDFSGWSGVAGLVAGLVGLEGYARWIDRDATPETLRAQGLPPKARPNPTPEQALRAIRRQRRGRPEWCRSGKVIARDLYQVVVYAEWAMVARGIEPSADGALLRLLDADLLAAHFAARARERGLARTQSVAFAQTAYTCATLASPFGEARALQVGDTALAERLRAEAGRLFELAERSMPPDQEREGVAEKMAVWEGDGTEGYVKLATLVDLLVDEVEAHGGAPLRDQVAAVRAGAFATTDPARWAAAVRSAVLIALCRRVPLRADNWAMLQVRDRRDAKGLVVRSAHWQVSEGAALWEGPIGLDFEPNEMKSGRAFGPAVITAREVGVAEAEADLRRDLLELWLRPGGARDEALRLPDGTVAPSPYLLPALARVGTRGGSEARRRARGYRLQASQVSGIFRTLVKRHARALGLDRRRLAAVFGAAGLHAIRHAFGTYWIRRGQLKFASVMLDHATTNITEKLYTAVRASQISIDAMARNSTLRTDDVTEQPRTRPAEQPKAGPSDVVTTSETILCGGCYEPRRVYRGRVAPICHACRSTETCEA